MTAPALCQCTKCLRYLARDRVPGGVQQCVECCFEESNDAEWSAKHGIPLADVRGPVTDPLTVELLGLLTEECGEVSQRVGKILRWGWKADHGGTTQKHKFHTEIADVLAVIQLLVHNDLVDRREVMRLAREKLDKFREDATGPRQRLTVAKVPSGIVE